MRGSTLQKEGAACAKGLSWARKEVDKLQGLGGGCCDWRAISKRDTGWDNHGDVSGVLIRTEGPWEGVWILFWGEGDPLKGLSRAEGVVFKRTGQNFSTIQSSPTSDTFLVYRPVQSCPEWWHQSATKSSNMLLTKADMVEGSNLRRLPSDTSRGPRVPPYHSLSTPIRGAMAGIWGFSHWTSKGHPACLCLSYLDGHATQEIFQKDLQEDVVDKFDFFLAELHNAELSLYRKTRVLIKHAKSCHKIWTINLTWLTWGLSAHRAWFQWFMTTTEHN